MADFSDYVALSVSVYYEGQDGSTNNQIISADDKPLTYLATNDWRVREVDGFQNTASGFYATAFQKGAAGEVVIAFRGTDEGLQSGLGVPWSNNDWVNNLEIYTNPLQSEQLQDAIDFVRAVIASGVSLSDITFTGHSLGGGLATLMSAMFEREAVVFDPAPVNTSHITSNGDPYTGIEYLSVLRPAEAPVLSAGETYINRADGLVTQYVLNGESLSSLFDSNKMPGTKNVIDIGSLDTPASKLHSMDLLALTQFRSSFVDLADNTPALVKWLVEADITGLAGSIDNNASIFIRRLINENDLFNNFHSAMTKVTGLFAFGPSSQILDPIGETIIKAGLITARQRAEDNQGNVSIYGDDSNTVSIDYRAIGTRTPGPIGPNNMDSEILIDIAGKAKSIVMDRSELFPSASNIGVIDVYHFAVDNGEANHIGGSLRDLFIGGIQADIFHGGDGDDIILGGGSGLPGGANLLFGDAGADILIAEAGINQLSGGAGRDTFGVGDKTYLMDLEGNETVKWSANTLKGAKDDGTGVFKDQAGYIYTFADDAHVTVTKNGQTVTVIEASGGPSAGNDELFHVGSIVGRKAPEEKDTQAVHNSAQGLVNSAVKDSSSPLVLDLDSDGIELKSVESSWTRFDIDNDGFTEVSGWVSGDDGLLAWDKNSNGKIDDSTELFGSATTDGFSILAALDSNLDGYITSADTNWNLLSIWQDFDEDGNTDGGELANLASWSITSINLNYTGVNIDNQGNTIKQTSTFTMNGESHEIVDAWFTYDDFLSRYNGPITPDSTISALPNLTGYGNLTDLRVAMMQDSALVTAVQSFNARTITDYVGMRQDVAEILQRWAGIANPTYVSGRPSDVDLTTFLKKYFAVDESTVQKTISGAFQTIAFAQEAWTLIAEMQLGRLLAPRVASLLPGLSVDLYDGPLVGNVNFTTLAAAAPAAIPAAQAYWTGIKNALLLYAFASGQGDDAWNDELTAAILTTGKTMAQLGFTFAPVTASITTTATYNSGTGNDTLTGNELNNTINGGTGDDLIVGNDGSDTLRGGVGYDTLQGGLGNDFLYGDDGNDTIHGDDGDDTIQGLNGNDTLYGGAGVDNITGGAGDDTIYGGDGNDTISGDANQDVIYGGLGNDTLTGGAGHDVIYGEDGNDTLNGSDGNDLLVGGAGDDALGGAQGQDILDSGAGNDIMDGGQRDDIYILTSGQDTITDSPGNGLGDDGGDTIQLWDGVTLNQLEFIRNGTTLIIKHPNAVDQVTINNQFYGTSSSNGYRIEILKFSDGSQVNMSQIAVPVYGTSGNDTLTGTYAQTLASGILTGYNGSPHETFFGYGGNDTITAGEGNDILFGGSGTDNLNGGNGRDMASYADQVGRVFANQTYSSVTVNGVTIAANHVSLRDVANNATIIDQDTLTSIEGIAGGASDDILVGSGFTDGYMRGGGGSDYIEARGADYGDATSGARVNLNTTTETLGGVSVVGRTALDGMGGTDTFGVSVSNIMGSAHADYILGNNMYHWFSGGAGDDYLNPSGGTGLTSMYGSIMSGDAGNDQLIGSAAVSGYTAVDEITYFFSPFDVRINIGSGTKILGGISIAGLTAQDGWGTVDTLYDIEDVRGSYFTNTHIAGNDKANILYAYKGNDSVYGMGGDDIIRMGYGNDLADGGAGNDKIYFENYDSYTTTIQGDLSVITVYGLNDTVYGGDGDDEITSPGGGYIDGGNGQDTWISNSSAGIYVNLGSSAVTYGGLTIGAGVIKDAYFGDIGRIANVEILKIAGFVNGSDAAETMHGQNNSDVLWGGGGNDTLYGLGGNDTLKGGVGADILDGGSGNDIADYSDSSAAVRINLGASSQTLGGVSVASNTGYDGTDTDILTMMEGATGSVFGDWVYGSSVADVISGLDGSDTLSGNDGDDILSGGLGVDSIDGGNGSDTVDQAGLTGTLINLSSSSRVLNGVTVAAATATDTNASGGAVDTLISIENAKGSSGDDWIYGSTTANTISGGDGNDSLDGSDGDDTLNGDAGDDRIIGGNGNDILNGGAGNDVIIAGAGNDTINGGSDVDLLDFSSATSGILVNDSSTAQTLNGVLVGARQNIDGFGGTDSVSDIENIIGSSYDDYVYGSAGSIANVIRSGAGNDWLFSNAGNDILIGGAGNDTLNGGTEIDTADYSESASGIVVNISATSQTLNGSSVAAGQAQDGLGGVDTLIDIENITGTSGNDFIYGSALANSLVGGAGVDWLSGDAGNDVITGDDGDDVLIGGAGNDTLNGGAGTDVISFVTSTASVLVNMGTTTQSLNGTNVLANQTRDGLAGTDVLVDIENVTGSTYNDFIYGSASANHIQGGSGDDTLLGGAGNDILDGGSNVDTISYITSTGAVLINISSSAQTLNGTVIAAGQGQDGLGGVDTFVSIETVIGSVYNDYIYANSDANTLWGFSGNDYLVGGAGNDILNGENGDDTLLGGAGNDTITGGADYDTVDFSDSASAILVNISAAAVTLNGTSVSSNQALDGAGGVDTLNTIEFITGSGFNDFMWGSSIGNILDGGAGNDWLKGDAGADWFNWRLGGGSDTIADFTNASDKLRLVGTGANYAALSFADTANGATVTLSGNVIFTLTGVAKSVLDSSDFLFA